MHLFQVRSRPPAPAFHWKASQVVRDRGRTPAGGVPPCTPTTSPMPVRRMDHVLPEMDLLCTPGFKELQEFNNCSLPEAVNGEADRLTWLSRRQIEVASRWTVHADPTPNRPRCNRSHRRTGVAGTRARGPRVRDGQYVSYRHQVCRLKRCAAGCFSSNYWECLMHLLLRDRSPQHLPRRSAGSPFSLPL
jgi:hypothetical protein